MSDTKGQKIAKLRVTDTQLAQTLTDVRAQVKELQDLANAAPKFNQIIQENQEVVTEGGSVLSLTEAIESIDADFSGLSFLTDDYLNAPDRALEKLGIYGIDKKGKITPLPGANLATIDKNSLYYFNKVGDAPFSSDGIVETYIIDSNNYIQIVYKLDADIGTPVNSFPVYYRIMASGKLSAWLDFYKFNASDTDYITLLHNLKTQGDIIYMGDNSPQILPIGNEDEILTSKKGLPVWASNEPVAAITDLAETFGAPVINCGWGLVVESYYPLVPTHRRSIPAYFTNDDMNPLLASQLDQTQHYEIEKIIIGNYAALTSSGTSENSPCLIILKSGNVMGCGLNSDGQLGVGNTATQVLLRYPTSALQSKVVEKVVDGTIDLFNSSFRASDGRVWLCGSNQSGQLADGTTKSSPTPILMAKKDWKKIIQHRDQFFGIDNKDDLYSWGYGGYKTLGTGSTSNSNTPTKILSNVAKCLIANYYQVDSEAIALTDDGKIFTWGKNNYGCLGFGDTTARLKPTEVVALGNDNIDIATMFTAHMLVVKSNHSVMAAGWNGHGELGIDTSLGNRFNVFTAIPGSLRAGKKIVKIVPLSNYNGYTNYSIIYDDGIILTSVDHAVRVTETGSTLGYHTGIAGEKIIDAFGFVPNTASQASSYIFLLAESGRTFTKFMFTYNRQ